jgi:hypothetical protein
VNREELAWAAGLFEGEGSFFLTTIRKNGKEYVYPTAALRMTDEDSVLRFQRIIGFGTVHSRDFKDHPKYSHYKKSFVWRANGFERTQAVAAFLWSGLGKRRKEAVRYVLSFQ